MSANQLWTRAKEKSVWSRESRDGLDLLFSPLLVRQTGLTHAFTTRLGGETRDPYKSFNLGRHVEDGDLRNDALANRRKLCQTLALSFDRLIVPGQVHSRNVVIVEDREEGASLDRVDGLTTASRDVPMLLHFADCVPVIVFDPGKGVAGIFHAGWRGTAQSIVAHGVSIMKERFGCSPGSMVAAVGPAIGSCCYPTGEEVVRSLEETAEGAGHLIESREGKQFPDLKAINALQLLAAGVGAVDVSDSCTACNPDVFYSHRQSGGITGRQGAVACII
ncbi:MAG: peptidoglycan editing factor PgeF [Cyanobacteria bacterium HKST-UBA02]|nr:peptidoglycan editing factor PgeF [Cyanobacteria bacterium HKST-UBA02]